MTQSVRDVQFSTGIGSQSMTQRLLGKAVLLATLVAVAACGSSSSPAPGVGPSTGSGTGSTSGASTGAGTTGTSGADTGSPSGTTGTSSGDITGSDVADASSPATTGTVDNPGSPDGSTSGDSTSPPPPPSGDAGNDVVTTPPVPASNRTDVLLDDSWKFVKMDVAAASGTTFDDSSWSAVTLPHTWNVADASSASYYQGPGWYRRHYTVPAQYAGRKLFIQVDAANKVADVYVNGTHLGQHRGGNAAFRFDATAAFKVGADNVIAIKCDNTAFADVAPLSPSSSGPDFTQFGGVYRDVHLLVTDPVHIDVLDYASPGVFITPKSVTAASANLDVRVELVNDDTASHTVTVEADLLDATGAVVKTMSMSQALAPTAAGKNTQLTLSTTVTSPHLWNGRIDPYLYTVQVLVKDGATVRDALSQSTGFRFFSLSSSTGFSLNGKYYDLHGVNRHQERQGVGWALKNSDHDTDMALIKEIGATVVRLCHYQQSQYFHDLADQNGIVLWAEVGIVHLLNATTMFTDNATQQLTELIRQSYNHPSIVFWSLSNELVGSTATSLMTTMNTLAHTEDPTRITTLADNATADAKAMIPDTVGYNYYDGWYSGAISDISTTVDGAKTSTGSKPFGISEYGAGSNITNHSANPAKMDYSEEYQSLFHEGYWAVFSTRQYLWGKMVWSMFDFPSSYRAGSSQEKGINNKGLVTHDHLTRKDAFYFYKATWSTDPCVYITSRRFEPRTSASTNIKVYSNSPSVSLTLNGTSLGSKTSTNHIFTWTGVTLTKGSNKAVAAGSGAGAPTDTVTWTLQ